MKFFFLNCLFYFYVVLSCCHSQHLNLATPCGDPEPLVETTVLERNVRIIKMQF